MATEFTITPIPYNALLLHKGTLGKRLKEIYAGPFLWMHDLGADKIVVQATDAASFTAQQEADITAVFSKHLAASMETDKFTIDADDTDVAVITMSEAAIQNGDTIDVEVYGSDCELDISDTVTATAGAAQYAFAMPLADTYKIIMKRQSHNEGGIITIIATEV